jgi:hypothetical protein
VEQGEYCRRLNPNGVDLNRNWNIYWGKNIQLGEENPGKKPFSEVETRFLSYLIKDLQPKIFLTLHSGVFGLYMPHAFYKKEAEKNGKQMKEVLEELKKKFCPICQVGAPSVNIGYQSSGTCLDYAYEKLNVPYAFVWEIFTNEKKLPELEEYRKTHSKTNKTKPLSKKKSSFLETSYTDQMNMEEKMKFLNKRTFTRKENDYCLHLFNPLDELGVKFIKNQWTKVKLY